MTTASSTTNNPINVISKMDDINQYKHDIAIAPISAKRKKFIAKYNLIKTIESMDITLNEKIALSGMTGKRYELSRRILKSYPTLESFEAVVDNGVTYFEEFTEKRNKQETDVDIVYGKINRLFGLHNMPSGSPERNEVVTKLATNNTIQLHTDDDNYFRYGDCLICGEAIQVGGGTIKHFDVKGVQIPYPCCPNCADDEPEIEDVLLSQYRYGNVMRSAYEEILSSIR